MYEEASSGDDLATWHLAMDFEIPSIQQNKIWDLVGLLKNWCVLPCKWIYPLKDSASPKYKVKLVLKGFPQEYDINFDEIFSLVVKMTTLQFLLDGMATI